MTKRKIILVPDEILKKKSEKIEKLTNKEKQLADDLFETMYRNNGIGLAAVQVGVLRRMIVIDVSKKDEKKNLYFWLIHQLIINQKICQFMRRAVYLYQAILLRLKDQLSVI